jgi:hypothetical protein
MFLIQNRDILSHMNKEGASSYYKDAYKEGISAAGRAVGGAGKVLMKELTRKGDDYRNEGIARKWGRRMVYRSSFARSPLLRQVLFELSNSNAHQ